jgi:DHA3 family macrolide efflux protein-like MFS transporter
LSTNGRAHDKISSVFWLFYASFAVSTLGDSFRLLAISVWIFNSTSGSIGARLLVLLFSNVPGMLLGGLSGVIADRYDKYTILVVADLIRTVVGLGLAWCAADSRVAYALVLVAVGNSVGVFFSSSSFSLLPRLLPKEKLPRGNGLMETGQWVIQIVGPSLAAITLVAGGATIAFLVDSASFVCSALILWRLRQALTVPNAAGQETLPEEEAQADFEGTRSERFGVGAWREFVAGMRIITRTGEIRALLLASYGVAFLTACTNFGLIFLVARTLALGSASLGYIYSLNGAVAVLAAAAVTMLAKSAHLGRLMAFSMLGLCVAQVVMGIAPNLYVLGIGVTISALANAPYNVSVTSLYMSKIPAEYLGRVEGIDAMIDNLVSILGFVAAALAVLWWNPRAVFLLSALVALPSLLVAFIRVARTDSDVEIPENEVTPSR